MPQMDIILGSGSPRRQELMAQEGFVFQVMTSNCDESYSAGMAPVDVATTLATRKARSVADDLAREDDGWVVLGADTIVALGDTIFGKPIDAADAAGILERLSGKTHQVITGVCLVTKDRCQSFAEVTNVTFKDLSKEEIEAYVATGEPLDKAGAYGIQGLGGNLVKSTEGSFSNVVGLPIEEVGKRLRELLA